jgi:small conductance mechanosensitive channel
VSSNLDELGEWIDDRGRAAGAWLVSIGLDLLLAAVVVLLVVFVSRRLRRRVRDTMERRRVGANLLALLDNLFKIAVWVLVVSLVLAILGTDAGSLVTAFGLATAAITLSLQDVLKNFVAGLYLLAERPFGVGDRIEVTGVGGNVERIDVRTTVLRNDRAEQVLVPNFKIFTEVVVNRSAYGLGRLTARLEGIQASPLEAEAAIRDALADLPAPPGRPPTVAVVESRSDAVAVDVTIWYTAGAEVRGEVLARLRLRFPDAVLSLAAD